MAGSTVTADILLSSAVTNAADLVQAPHSPVPKVQFGPLEVRALEQIVSGDASAAIEHARGLAEALAGSDRDGVRLRLLSKALAQERALQALLESVLAEQVARGSLRGIHAVNEALRGCVARLERLAVAHRQESLSGQRTPVVMIGHADSVDIRSP